MLGLVVYTFSSQHSGAREQSFLLNFRPTRAIEGDPTLSPQHSFVYVCMCVHKIKQAEQMYANGLLSNELSSQNQEGEHNIKKCEACVYISYKLSARPYKCYI